MQVIVLNVVHQCCGPAFSEFCFAPADGTRGGILIAWRADDLAISARFVSPCSVVVHGIMPRTQKSINLIAVYGPQADNQKAVFLQSLNDTISANLPAATATIIARDFNLIVKASDKNNQNINRRNMAAFRGFINDLQLKDLYLHGRRYT